MRSALHVVILASVLAIFAPESRAQTPASSAAKADTVSKPTRTGRSDQPRKTKLAPEAVFAGVSVEPAKREQAKALVAKSRAAFQAILARQTPGKVMSTEDRAALKQIGEEHNTAYRALLTEAQRQRLDANLAALRPAKSTTPAPVSTSPTGSSK